MTDLDRPELPGSAMLAAQIERRRVLRTAAGGVFLGLAAAMAGEFRFATHALANPNRHRPDNGGGKCCPGFAGSCCGPSPCCNTACCNRACCAPNDFHCSGGCTPHVEPYDNTNGCWSCQNGNYVTTCCDCNFPDPDGGGCPTPSGLSGICICYRVLHLA